jgi:hypothetical protein
MSTENLSYTKHVSARTSHYNCGTQGQNKIDSCIYVQYTHLCVM